MAPMINSKNRENLKRRPPIASNINKTVSEYFQSKREEQTAIKHYPEWDAVKGEPIIELMRLRRELLIADADLDAKRAEYKSRRELADRQWQDLREKQKALHDSFIKFNDFIRENRDKRDRALRKIQDELERQKIREAEIIELEKNLEYIEKARDKMQGYVEEYKPFKQYLEKVIETNEFQSIAEIFNRYETLIAARKALVGNQDENLEILEQTSTQLQKMTEDKSQSLLDLNSRLAQLQSRHERARSKALHWEVVVSRVKETTSRKELEETQVRACIWNLYRQICRRKGVPIEAKREQLEEQLLHVKRTIIELGKIVHAAKQKTALESRVKYEKEKSKEKGAKTKLNNLKLRESVLSIYEDIRSIWRN